MSYTYLIKNREGEYLTRMGFWSPSRDDAMIFDCRTNAEKGLMSVDFPAKCAIYLIEYDATLVRQ